MKKTMLSPNEKLNKLRYHQHAYTVAHGGPFELRECDEVYNKLTRLIIRAYCKAHPQAFIGSINLYGSARTDFTEGKTSILNEYKGEKICDFGCDFIVPVKDQTLEELLRLHNASWTEAKPNCPDALDKAINRIYKLGGEVLLWT